METANKTTITVETTVKGSKEKVWKVWNEPQHITNWAFASDDWHAPHAENDVRVDGKFKTVMAAKDGSFNFEFDGVYTDVKEFEKIEYKIADGRSVEITFVDLGDSTQVIETFEPEGTNPIEMQKGGWQAILNNFKKYAESI